jgi:hypothetical protein
MAAPVSNTVRTLNELMRLADTDDTAQLPALQQRFRQITPTTAHERQLHSVVKGKLEALGELAKILQPTAPSAKKNYVVALDKKANQHEQDKTPRACTFHAAVAIGTIQSKFDEFFRLIETNNAKTLSAHQIDVIKRGLELYEAALQKDHTLVEGADIEHILRHLPRGVSLKEHDTKELRPFADNLKIVVDRLFSQGGIKTVLIKSGNEESFAVLSDGNRVIVFDSHHSQIIGLVGREETQKFLNDKLSPFKNEADGLDFTPFAFAF